MQAFKHFWQAEYNHYNFELYGTEHMAAIYTLLGLIAILAVFRNKISPRVQKHMKVASSVAAISLDFLYHVWSYLNHEDFWGGLLPLQLCDITLILSLIFNLGNRLSEQKKQKVFELIYFWGVGAVSAIVFPTLIYGANKFRFYHFFGVHMYIVLTMVYGLVVEKYRITFASFLNSLKGTFLLSIVVLPIDRITGRNYMFLLHAPETPSPLDNFGGGLEYYIGFCIMSTIVLFLFYLPCGAINFVKTKAVDLEDEYVDL